MKTILIVEDDDATREAYTELLRKDDRVITTAHDGKEAMELLRSNERPSLIVLDLAMPGMDGWNFLRWQASDPVLACVPTIVVSGAQYEAPPEATDFVFKPIDPARFLSLVDDYLLRHG